jgi:D-amino-acid dehydrogenase
LTAEGHQVTVFERGGAVAAEGSFANAGLVAPALLAALGPLPVAARTMQALSPRHLRWLWSQRRLAQAQSTLQARVQLAALARHSQTLLQDWRRQLKLDYERSEGLLILLRSARDEAALQAGLTQPQATGLALRSLSASQARLPEPGLNPELRLHGAMHLLQDEAGNARQFAQALRLQAQRQGARFRFHTTVRSIQAGASPSLVHAYTPPEHGLAQLPAAEAPDSQGQDTRPQLHSPEEQQFDAILLCCALSAATLLKAAGGPALPLAEVSACSLTAPLRQLEAHPDLGPRSALLDLQQQVLITRLGQRLRVSGPARLAAASATDEAQQFVLLHKVLHDCFPGAAHLAQAQRWSARAACLPDGLPLLGPAGPAGLWINVAHGLEGWTLACAAAQVLADGLAGRSGALVADALSPARLR